MNPLESDSLHKRHLQLSREVRLVTHLRQLSAITSQGVSPTDRRRHAPPHDFSAQSINIWQPRAIGIIRET